MRTLHPNSIIHLNLITFAVTFIGCAPEADLISTAPDQGRPIFPSTDDTCGDEAQLEEGVDSGDSTGEEPPGSVVSLTLHGNTPNPFNPVTELSFAVPENGGLVILSIHSVDGRLARKLVAAVLPGGEHRVVWKGKDDAGRQLPSGVYFASLRSGGEVRNRKLAMVQ